MTWDSACRSVYASAGGARFEPNDDNNRDGVPSFPKRSEPLFSCWGRRELC